MTPETPLVFLVPVLNRALKSDDHIVIDDARKRLGVARQHKTAHGYLIETFGKAAAGEPLVLDSDEMGRRLARAASAPAAAPDLPVLSPACQHRPKLSDHVGGQCVCLAA